MIGTESCYTIGTLPFELTVNVISVFFVLSEKNAFPIEGGVMELSLEAKQPLQSNRSRLVPLPGREIIRGA